MTIKTLDQAIEYSEGFDVRKHDYLEQARNMRFDETGRLNPSPYGSNYLWNVGPLELTDNALTQLCAKSVPMLHGKGSGTTTLPVAHHRQLLSTFPDLFAQQFNRFLEHANGTKWFVRGYDKFARAILSDRYVDLPNTELLEMTSDALRDTDYQLIRPYVSGDGIGVKIMVRDDLRGPDGKNYGTGIAVYNDEIGRGSAKIVPMVQRTSCTNSIVWVEGGIKLRHVGNKSAKMTLLASTIIEVLPKTEQMLDAFFEKQREQLPNIADVVRAIGSKYALPDKTVDVALVGTEGDSSAAAVVNAFTYAAHATADLSQDERDRLEDIGGQMLFTAAASLVRMGNVYADAQRQTVTTT